MKKHLIILILFIALLWPTTALPAQERFADRYNISYITMNEGLPHNFIDDLFKDSRGFLWISTAGGGLSRYDGYDFVTYTPNTAHCRLKSNFIRNVCEDNFERLWVVSEGGTDVIDLVTLKAVIPADVEGKLNSLLTQPATYLCKDAKGCIWLHATNTLHRIEFDQNGAVKMISSLPNILLNGPDIAMHDIDGDGTLWAAINGNIVKIAADKTGKLRKQELSNYLNLESGTYISDFVAKENEVWIATDQGLYRYSKKGYMINHYQHNPADLHSLTQNYLTDLAFTKDDQLLITTLRGINVYNPLTDNFERISRNITNDGNSHLNSNFINCILIDEEHFWFGTETGGIDLLSPRRLAIRNYQHDKENAYSLSDNPVNAIFEDHQGTLWVGTVESGLNRKERGSERFTHYTRENGGLSHNSVSALTADANRHLWVGTWGGGVNLINLEVPQKVEQIISSGTTGGIPLNFVGALTFDPINKGMWIGANQGLFFYDFERRKVVFPLPQEISERIHGCVGSIIDKDGQLWIGCLEGVYIINLHSRSANGLFKYKHLNFKLDHPQSKLIEKITCFYETKDGTLWLGSNGYGVYERKKDAQGKDYFISYTTAQGLANNSVRGILQDEQGNLWMGTNNGLSCFSPTEKRFINYTLQDGLIDTQFYWNASFQGQHHLLYFGSVSGLTAIECNRPRTHHPAAKIRFTRLRIGNEEILPGSEYLQKDIAISSELELHEKEKSFSLEFSALNFQPNNTATYSYRLLGFDEQWVQVPANRRFASYTNLPPGSYTLQVKYSSDSEDNPESITELKITIVPYFYKRIGFIWFIIALALLCVWQVYQWRIRNLKRQREHLHCTVEERTHELEQQKRLLENQTEELSRQNHMLTQQNEKISQQKEQLVRMSRKVQELSLDRIAFFTNITHEFRTPITLIIGPIERALKLSSNPQVIEQLHFVERNSRYLLSLVNQLMDFRKVESGKLEIVKTKGNFIKFVDTLITPFEVFAGERNITLKRFYRMKTPDINYDEEGMHKVITNLLSNAIKFTPNSGTVSLYISSVFLKESGKESLYICVKDNGTGIPEEDLSRIFNRFYQSRNQVKYPVYGQAGTGIGLYLCKRIVHMHGGEIKVRNNPQGGCSFRIFLPLQKEELKDKTILVHSETSTASPIPSTTATKEKLTLLVVEDNADMRGYIRSILRERYHVLEAENGKDALQLLGSNPVDFIISDLMMPIMDGIELSRKVKETFAISHIPFLMLTAKTSQEARLESYRMGVDEYLLKPFDETLLLTRIQNILDNRKRYQQKFTLDMDVAVLQMEEESGDKKFLNQVMEVIKTNYNNAYFEISDFCEAMGVSKSLLNKKLQSLLGQSAGQFIRNYRLNIARELIIKNRETKAMNIAEIAYEVGFNDPKYFTRCFTKHFNGTPSALLNNEI